MTDQELSPPISDPGPWGSRKLGSGAGLQRPPNAPNLPEMTALEGRINRIEGAAAAGFIFLIVAFGGGYVLLSGQQAASTDKLATKLDAISTQIGDVRTDVAVLKERSSTSRPSASQTSVP